MIPPTKRILKSINKLIDYSFTDEKKHWEECNRPKNHIYSDIRRIRWWLTNKSNKKTP